MTNERNKTEQQERISAGEWLENYKHEARAALRGRWIENPTEKQIFMYILYKEKSLKKA